MKKIAIVIAMLVSMDAYAGLFDTATYESCILDNMPGTTEWGVGLIVSKCNSKPAARPGAGRGLFAKYSSGWDCFIDKGTKVASQAGKGLIFISCGTLYDKPK
ncbi:hypothetical protein LJR296_007781 [Cupriavidus necator]|uniref:hypothetical protein n=1 Tax=Cupriavidus necator TaxID=106590 RepID=UPI003ECEB92C